MAAVVGGCFITGDPPIFQLPFGKRSPDVIPVVVVSGRAPGTVIPGPIGPALPGGMFNVCA
jgi:hypothetical protein